MQLAGDTGASVATVKRAFKVLHDEGVIYSVNGRGTFVADR
jgi:DNA-binding GntR family transcriptional regulator